MTIELSLFNNSVTTLVNQLTSYYGEEAKLETYVICMARKPPKAGSRRVPRGSPVGIARAPARARNAAADHRGGAR